MGGGQSINIDQTAHAFIPSNSNFTCINSSCQNDNLQITQSNVGLEYPINLAGSSIENYRLTYLNYGNSYLTYQSCIGQIFGGFASQTTPTSQPINFPCALGRQQTYDNYQQACKNSNGIYLVINTTEVPGQTFVNYVACYQIVSTIMGQIFQVKSAEPQYQVSVSLNGQVSSINQSIQQNMSNPNIQLINVGSGFYSQDAPSPDISLLSMNNTDKIISGASTTIMTEISAFKDTELSGVQVNYIGQNETLSSFSNAILKIDTYEYGVLQNSTVNTQFATAQLQTQSQFGGIPTGFGIFLPDPTNNYVRPTITMLIKASYVGLYEGFTSFVLQNSNLPSQIRSGSTATGYITIVNNGTISGGYIVTPSSQQGISFTPDTPQQGVLNPGQQQTISFKLNDNTNVSSNTTVQYQIQVCGNGYTNCKTYNEGFILSPECNNINNFNTANCRSLVTTAPPVTTIPGTQTTTGTTTTLPICNNSNQINCSCSNNQNNCNNNNNIGLGWYILAGFGALIIIYLLTKRNGGGGYNNNNYNRRYNRSNNRNNYNNRQGGIFWTTIIIYYLTNIR